MNANREVGLSLLLDVWRDGRFELLEQLCQPDVRRHHPRFPAVGLEQYRQVIAVYRAAFTDLHYEVRLTFGDADSLAVVYDVSGTQTGAYGPVPPTGRRGTVPCIDIYQFRAGRISDVHAAIDELGILMQLGVLPS